MIIFVKNLTGKIISIECEANSTVQEVKQRYQDAGQPSVRDQKLFYGGKELDNNRTLEVYNIQKEATLHVIFRTPESSSSTNFPAFPTRGENDLPPPPTSQSLNELAASEYISNPHFHYEKLESFQYFVEWHSEFRQCKGVFELSSVTSSSDRRLESCSGLFKELLVRILDQKTSLISRFPISSAQGSTTGLRHLATTYLIVLQVLRSFDILQENRFCTESFYVIVKSRHTGSTVAEVKCISRASIALLVAALEDVMSQFSRQISAGHTVHIRDQDLQALSGVSTDLWKRLGFDETSWGAIGSYAPNRGSFSRNALSHTEMRCRLLAFVLDAGLVSYVGSHGSKSGFDKRWLGVQQRVYCIRMDWSLVQLSLQKLACLDDFFQGRVWVFHQLSALEKRDNVPATSWDIGVQVPKWGGLESAPQLKGRGDSIRHTSDTALALLTRMDAFADLWGPVWTVHLSTPHLQYSGSGSILEYQLSSGSIRRIKNAKSPASPRAVQCHWYPTQDLDPSNLQETDIEKLLLKSDDLLLIGAQIANALEENLSCDGTMDDFERIHGMDMSPLGTQLPTWVLESRTIAVTGGYQIGLTIQGTQKMTPQVSLKKLTWTKLKNEPSQAPSEILSQMTGLEISLCTGNARRIQLKELILMTEIQRFLDRKISGWRNMDFANPFLQSLRDNAFEKFWDTHFQMRADVTKLILCILDALNETGLHQSGTYLNAAFINGISERAMSFKTRENEWCRMLKDTNDTAVYAVATNTCLNCRAETTNVRTHGQQQAFTALETLVRIREESIAEPFVLLSIGKEIVEFDKFRGDLGLGEDIIVLTQPRGLERVPRLLSRVRSPRLAYTAREVLDERQLGGRQYRALVKAQRPSRACRRSTEAEPSHPRSAPDSHLAPTIHFNTYRTDSRELTRENVSRQLEQTIESASLRDL